MHLPNSKPVSGNPPPCGWHILYRNRFVPYKLIVVLYELFLQLLRVRVGGGGGVNIKLLNIKCIDFITSLPIEIFTLLREVTVKT